MNKVDVSTKGLKIRQWIQPKWRCSSFEFCCCWPNKVILHDRCVRKKMQFSHANLPNNNENIIGISSKETPPSPNGGLCNSRSLTSVTSSGRDMECSKISAMTKQTYQERLSTLLNYFRMKIRLLSRTKKLWKWKYLHIAKDFYCFATKYSSLCQMCDIKCVYPLFLDRNEISGTKINKYTVHICF